jgi:phosphatidylserine/phosphatidylglycerophosphate/cardiolipin synthase-like enzyme
VFSRGKSIILDDVPDHCQYRESEPTSWEDTMKDTLDRERFPRMPWHDVHCALWGPPCRDLARHFVQRWNHAKVLLYLCIVIDLL